MILKNLVRKCVLLVIYWIMDEDSEKTKITTVVKCVMLNIHSLLKLMELKHAQSVVQQDSSQKLWIWMKIWLLH